MKLLYDQNLSRKLVRQLESLFPNSAHTSTLGLERAEDQAVWNRAADEGYVVVSKDTDFLHLALVNGHPPKVIYLEMGNSSTDAIATLLTKEFPQIRLFVEGAQESLLILKPR